MTKANREFDITNNAFKSLVSLRVLAILSQTHGQICFTSVRDGRCTACSSVIAHYRQMSGASSVVCDGDLEAERRGWMLARHGFLV
jgi:hypothetical protein